MLARELDPTILSNLVAVLQKNLDHDSCNNAIEGYVEYTEIGIIVQKLGTSIETLHQTLNNGQRPRLEHPISFLDGQHRVEAAKIAFGENAMWTVRLLSRPSTNLSAFIQNRATCQTLDRLSHQTRYSDGEVFRQVTQLWKTSSFEQAREWTARLGAQKRVNLDMIKDNHRVFSCLDGLSHFPGLLSDMPLGSFHKHLALHCDDEIANYLQHIRHVWLGLTCNHPDIVDVGTVQLLEGRAPGMSDIDRQLVEEAFDSNEIFSKAQNPQLRDQIRRSVLRFKGLVPSLKSYQENMKYISIGVTVVDDLMFPDSARTKSWKRQQTDRRTFRDMLRQHWSPPRQNLVEVREGVLAQCVGEPVFDVAYKQVILAAMPPLTVSHRNSQDATVQNLAARHQVEHTRPDSIMSLTAVVQDPMDEWLEASLARAQHVESGLETSYLSRTSSQSRSGIDTPLHKQGPRVNDPCDKFGTGDPLSAAFITCIFVTVDFGNARLNAPKLALEVNQPSRPEE
ncbi:hypothetical protein CABS03_06573 [Colletotrichum abscissum]